MYHEKQHNMVRMLLKLKSASAAADLAVNRSSKSVSMKEAVPYGIKKMHKRNCIKKNA